MAATMLRGVTGLPYMATKRENGKDVYLLLEDDYNYQVNKMLKEASEE